MPRNCKILVSITKLPYLYLPMTFADKNSYAYWDLPFESWLVVNKSWIILKYASAALEAEKVWRGWRSKSTTGFSDLHLGVEVLLLVLAQALSKACDFPKLFRKRVCQDLCALWKSNIYKNVFTHLVIQG